MPAGRPATVTGLSRGRRARADVAPTGGAIEQWRASRLEKALPPLVTQGNKAMAEFILPPETFNIDKSSRAPTFVQIRAPAGPGIARRMLFIVGVGTALVAALGWAAYRLTVNQVAPVAMQAAPTVTETLTPQPVPADLYAELAELATDTAVSAPVWSRESLSRLGIAVRCIRSRSPDAFWCAAGRHAQCDASRCI